MIVFCIHLGLNREKETKFVRGENYVFAPLLIKGLLWNRHQVAKVLLSSNVGDYWGVFQTFILKIVSEKGKKRVKKWFTSLYR